MIIKKNCLFCEKTFISSGRNHKYCSKNCGEKYRDNKETFISDKEKLKLSELPIEFILNNIKPYQRTTILIKYYIKKQADNWTEKKYKLYEKLSEELNLSFERIRKIAKE